MDGSSAPGPTVAGHPIAPFHFRPLTSPTVAVIVFGLVQTLVVVTIALLAAYAGGLSSTSGLPAVIGMIAIIGFSIARPFTFGWFMSRATLNQGYLGPRGRMPSSAAYWGWFLPLANVVLPALVLHAISVDPATGRHKRRGLVVCWRISVIAADAGLVVLAAVPGLPVWPTAALNFVSAVLTVHLFTRIGADQHRRAIELDQSTPEYSIAPVGSSFVMGAVALMGLAAVAAAPFLIETGIRSQIIPEASEGAPATEATTYVELETGERLRPGSCFSTVDGTLELVDCTEAHTGEVYGELEVDAFAYPGDDATYDYATIPCWEFLEINTGYADVPEGLSHLIVYPSEGSWLEGDRLISCTFDSEDGAPLTQVYYAPTNRLAPAEMEVGRCYTVDGFNMTFEETACKGGFRLKFVDQMETKLDAIYPTNFLEGIAEGVCADTPWMWIPDQEAWSQGDRTLFCFVEAE